MNSTTQPAEFRPPPPIEEAWNRVRNRGGATSDLKAVVTFLGQLWAFDGSDPRGFNRWLADLGVLKEHAPPSILREYKDRFDGEQKAKLRPTRDLLEALVVGPHSSEFFGSMSGFSSELKILAYRTAIATYRNEGIAFALAALSQENRWVIDESTKGLPNSAVLQTFSAYLKGARVPLALADDRPGAASESEFPIDNLFRLATTPFTGIAEELRNLPKLNSAQLIQLAETLVKRLPDRSFGQFVRMNASVLICVAAPASQLFDVAKHLLISTGEPDVANLLLLVGKEHLRSELRNANQERDPVRHRFLAAVIDGWRRSCVDEPDQFREEVAPFVSAKSPVVVVAARAGLAGQESGDRSKFERFLLRSLQGDKDASVREWLFRNPEFVNHLPIAKASLQTLIAILDACRAKRPAQALKLAAQVLAERAGTDPQRYWEEAIRTLTSIGGSEANTVFCGFVRDRIERGEGALIRDLMAREPSRLLLRNTFGELLEKITRDQDWGVLFDIYGARTTESELVAVLESAYQRNARLGAWISKQLVPRLLENESLSLGFHRSISNRDVVVHFARELACRTLDSVKYLHALADDWATTRAATKAKLLSTVQTGVRMGLLNTIPGTNLHSELSKVVPVVEEWATRDSPKINPAIASIASSEHPYEHPPNRESLERFFRGQAPGSKDFTLAAGLNPWILELVLGAEPGPWPKSELLLDQISKRFVSVAQLRTRAEQELKDLGRTVRVELASALRDILSDIESGLTGYFMFRDVLDQHGLHPVMEGLGKPIDQKELSSEKHKFIRDPDRRGRLRVFGLGIRIDDMVVSSGLIMNSGDENDRD